MIIFREKYKRVLCIYKSLVSAFTARLAIDFNEKENTCGNVCSKSVWDIRTPNRLCGPYDSHLLTELMGRN